MYNNYGVSYRAKSKIRPVIYLLIALFLLCLLLAVILWNIGSMLVVEDELTVEADLIILLMGSLSDRTLHAIDLYHADKGKQIVFIREHMMAIEQIRERGVELPSNADLAKQLALDLEVLESDVILLDGESNSTQDEAIKIKKYLEVERQDVKNVVIVTSKYHSYRSKIIFERALGDSVTVYSSPSPFDNFDGEQWWKSRSDTRSVIFEVIKLANYHLREKHQL